MLFHSFSSQTERREYGGSDFIELQCCKLKRGTSIKKIISVDHIEHWKTDSLYLSGDDMDNFLYETDVYSPGEFYKVVRELEKCKQLLEQYRI